MTAQTKVASGVESSAASLVAVDVVNDVSVVLPEIQGVSAEQIPAIFAGSSVKSTPAHHKGMTWLWRPCGQAAALVSLLANPPLPITSDGRGTVPLTAPALARVQPPLISVSPS